MQYPKSPFNVQGQYTSHLGRNQKRAYFQPLSDPQQPRQQFRHRYEQTQIHDRNSKLSQMNQRLTQQTQMIRMKNQYKRQKMIRQNSAELKRSRMSADRRKRYMQYGDNIGWTYGNSQRYQTQTQSLGSSRASNPILRQPIITHSNSNRQSMVHYQDSPSFKKPSAIELNQRIPSQIIMRQPVLQSSMFERIQPNDRLYIQKPSQSQDKKIEKKPYQQNKNIKVKSNVRFDSKKKEEQDNFEQFLDMDLKNSKDQSGRFWEEKQPVSPVTYWNDKTVNKQGQKHEIYHNTQPIIGSDSDIKQIKSNKFIEKVKNLIQRVDYDGKLMMTFLIALAIFLVILQLIK